MSTLSFNPAENINRILMDKNTKYVVVEGDSDIPKYESTIRALTNNIVDFEPVSLGCKDNIKSLLRDVKNNNFIAITDGDFDGHTMPKDARLIVLSRYSIENFIFCNSVLTPLVANLVKASEAKTRTWFDIKEWIDHLHKKLPLLLSALFYYQNNVPTDRRSWTNADLFVNNCWKVCSIKVNALLNDIFDNKVPKAKIRAFEKFKKLKKEDLVKYFPGKLLVKSLYLFIRNKFLITHGNARMLTTQIGNQSLLVTHSTSLLHKQVNLGEDLKPVFSFLSIPELSN